MKKKTIFLRASLKLLTNQILLCGADPELECPSCNQAHTCENIVDNFCRAEFGTLALFSFTDDKACANGITPYH